MTDLSKVMEWVTDSTSTALLTVGQACPAPGFIRTVLPGLYLVTKLI